MSVRSGAGGAFLRDVGGARQVALVQVQLGEPLADHQGDIHS